MRSADLYAYSLRSLETDRFERLRDPTHQRLLPDADVRG